MDRGQAHTLEAVAAAMLLLAGLSVALQTTAVTPLSASTSSQYLENQLQSVGRGVLASTAESGDLKRAVLYWDNTTGDFHNSNDDGYYTKNLTETDFARALNQTYGPRNVAYNVYVVYHTSNTETERKWMIRQGEPSDHAVSVSRSVTIVDGDNLVDADGSLNATTTVDDSSNFYAPDVGNGPGGERELYNFVRVEVVAWRI